MTLPVPAVTFDYSAWIERYPEFTGVSQPLAQAYFDEAGAYCANDTCNPAFPAIVYNGTTPVSLLSRLLSMLTAHIAWLNASRDDNDQPSSDGGQAASPLTGRIASAGQGSVNVSVQLDASGSPSEAFFTQSKYGFAFWQASAQFRTARYSARPNIIPENTQFPFWGGGRNLLVY